MFIPDPGSWFLPIPDPGSRIPDPGSKNSNKTGMKKFFWFFCSHKFHKTEYYFSFDMLKKKNLSQFSKNYWSFYPKNCHQALKNIGFESGIQDPGSGKKPIPDPGSRGQKGSGSRIPDPDPQHCIQGWPTSSTLPVAKIRHLPYF